MENSANPNPGAIFQIGSGFWPSKVLLSAVNLGLFTLLAVRNKMSASEIKAHYNWQCTDRNVYDFLDVLVGIGFLQRENVLEAAKYSNGVDADFFLDKMKPSYIGGIVEMFNNRLYGFWGNLEEGLKTGEPQNESKKGENLFEMLYSDKSRLKEFIHAMSGAQLGNFSVLSQQFDFSNYKTLVDIGGSAALLSILVAGANPQMTCTSWDLPAVAPIANEHIQFYNLQDRVKTATGDFFNDSFPNADVITMGNILHDWDEPTKKMLMQKAYDALPEGGTFVAVENMIDNERRSNVFGMLMSINMLIETGSGFDYTFNDFEGWAKEIGFKSVQFLPLAGPASAGIAVK